MSFTENYRLGELYCGPGGIGFAAKEANAIYDDIVFSISHVWATDYDKDSCNTFRQNICPDNPKSVICKDIRKLNFNSLLEISPIDALAFGFPCNDFSVVGEQKGIDGIYGPLYSYGIKALEMFKPLFFMAENVGGLRNSNDGKTFKTIMKKMIDAGYTITPHLYKFEEYGVPQARHRIIIVGFRNDLNLSFKIPAPLTAEKNYLTCREALENPPIPSDADNHELTKHASIVIERLKHIKPGENAFTANLPDHLTMNVNGATISQIYKRLDPDKPAYTVTGSGGGGTHVYHWKEPRALTNRERARLQTFPDDFIFIGSKESVRKQIGMAVPPKGVIIIFESILKTLAGVKYKHITPNISISNSLFDLSNNNLVEVIENV